MHLPETGALVLDLDDLHYSELRALPGLGVSGRFVIGGHLLDGDLTALRETIRAFLTLDRSALDAVTGYIYDYYLDVLHWQNASGEDWDLPEIPAHEAVWDHLTIGNEFWVEHTSGNWYVSIESECAWEPEHGLQIVFRDGHAVSKVGPYDGHPENDDTLIYRRQTA
jgi:hypothetical protein